MKTEILCNRTPFFFLSAVHFPVLCFYFTMSSLFGFGGGESSTIVSGVISLKPVSISFFHSSIQKTFDNGLQVSRLKASYWICISFIPASKEFGI